MDDVNFLTKISETFDVVGDFFQIIFLIITIIVALISGFVALRQSHSANKELEKENKIHNIYGHNNNIVIEANDMTNMQKVIAYNVDRFDEYHQLGINQSKRTFNFSLAFASVGFFVIISSLFIYDDRFIYPGIIGGAIIEAVAALFFHQSKVARQLMSEFFDKLRTDRKLEESLKLCDSIDNESMRNAVRVKLSMYFAGIEDSDRATSEIIALLTNNQKIQITSVSASETLTSAEHIIQ